MKSLAVALVSSNRLAVHTLGWHSRTRMLKPEARNVWILSDKLVILVALVVGLGGTPIDHVPCAQIGQQNSDSNLDCRQARACTSFPRERWFRAQTVRVVTDFLECSEATLWPVLATLVGQASLRIDLDDL